MRKPLVAIGMLGVTMDRGVAPGRWDTWRPSISLLSHEELLVDRLELIHQPIFQKTADQLVRDAKRVSPETTVRSHQVALKDPWDFGEVYAVLLDFADAYAFDPEAEDYLVHMTTGTHVAQICLYLLTEARYIPGRLIQTSPPPKRDPGGPGTYSIIDLDLSKYDPIAARFARKTEESLSLLKAGIATRNLAFNALVEQIERVAQVSTAPLLLTGETGVGKSQLARRIFELKKRRRQVEGELVEVNCATLRGDNAMSALFGHVKGAFTSAATTRRGLLVTADRGLLFLDEIGELGLDEQAMLLRALEQKTFLPLGSDREVRSDFQLIAGTNRDLRADVATGSFREDLLARINLWTFELPPLRERPEDLEPNLEFEIEQAEARLGHRVRFNREAREAFLSFAQRATWPGNFRDFHAAVERMATLAGDARIDEAAVAREIERLRYAWSGRAHSPRTGDSRVQRVLGDAAAKLDRFDRAQLEEVLRVCEASSSTSEAGRMLFAESRKRRRSTNDADRLRKYLARFGLDFADTQRA